NSLCKIYPVIEEQQRNIKNVYSKAISNNVLKNSNDGTDYYMKNNSPPLDRIYSIFHT
ncbi:hypothetical protein YYG_05207, partial [Plasmodium vinckei petteri]